MIRRLASLLAAAALAVVVTAAPASAADEVGVSQDGVTWSSQLTAPLFANGFLWVPGDVEERSFHVRNDGPSRAEVVVDVVAADPAGLLASPDLLLEARVGSGPWAEIQAGATRLQPARLHLPRGARTTITVRGSFRPETTASMDQVAPFEVRVTMSDARKVAGAGAVGQQGGGVLPDTGSGMGVGLLALGAALVGAGAALVRRRGERPAAVGGAVTRG